MSYVQILVCLTCRVENVLCADLSMSYVSSLEPLAGLRLAWLASLALHPYSTLRQMMLNVDHSLYAYNAYNGGSSRGTCFLAGMLV